MDLPRRLALHVATGFVGGKATRERTRFTHSPDASFSSGMGFGDPEHTVGLETVLSSYSTIRRPPFSVGGVSVKLHHDFSSQNLLFAVGVEDPIN